MSCIVKQSGKSLCSKRLQFVFTHAAHYGKFMLFPACENTFFMSLFMCSLSLFQRGLS